MTSTRVFVIHEQYIRTPGGKLDRKLDLTEAEAYGTLVRIFEGRDIPADPDKLVETAVEKLDDITRNDYILPVGSPYLIAIVSALVADITDGYLNMLVWERDHYNTYHTRLWEDEKDELTLIRDGK